MATEYLGSPIAALIKESPQKPLSVMRRRVFVALHRQLPSPAQ